MGGLTGFEQPAGTGSVRANFDAAIPYVGVGVPTEAPPLARARDASDDLDNDEAAAQLCFELGWAANETRRVSVYAFVPQ